MSVPTADWTVNDLQNGIAAQAPVGFYYHQDPDNFQTVEQGRPIFVERVYMKMFFPGDPHTVIDRRASQKDKDDHPKEYQAFLSKGTLAVQGTPISMWPALSETQKAEFRALNIFTIDQFAGMPDVHGAKIMGFNGLRQKAKAFLAACAQTEMVDGLRAETDEKVAKQAAEIEKLREMVLMLSAKKPAARKGRGPNKPKLTATMPASMLGKAELVPA